MCVHVCYCPQFFIFSLFFFFLITYNNRHSPSLLLNLYLFPFPLSLLHFHISLPSHSPPVYIPQDGESVRLATVLQENAVLKSEMEMLKLKCKNLTEENKRLRQASVNIVSYREAHVWPIHTHTDLFTPFCIIALMTSLALEPPPQPTPTVHVCTQ